MGNQLKNMARIIDTKPHVTLNSGQGARFFDPAEAEQFMRDSLPDVINPTAPRYRYVDNVPDAKSGARHVDVIVIRGRDEYWHEIKAGYQSKAELLTQIAKDCIASKTRTVAAVTWHFFASDTTASIGASSGGGPSRSILDAIEDCNDNGGSMAVQFHLPTSTSGLTVNPVSDHLGRADVFE